LLPLTYTRGVLEGRLTLEEMCAKLSTNPARIMGLAPRKGAVQVGADADIAIIHPASRQRVTPSAMETNADWSPYEGWELAGFARTTLSRGETIVDGYKVVGREGRGVWLPRTSAGLHPRPGSHLPPSHPSSTPPRPRAAEPVGAR
jgi:dihydropyrimidinase